MTGVQRRLLQALPYNLGGGCQATCCLMAGLLLTPSCRLGSGWEAVNPLRALPFCLGGGCPVADP